MKAIKGFQGQYQFLSNFWPCRVEYGGATYSSVELAYQAAKTTDHDARVLFAQCKTPGEAKRLGKKIKLRSDWDVIKVNIMHDLVRQKFKNNDELKRMLLSTGTAYLEETNNWGDKFWGVCNGEGTNFLGFILMLVRYEINLIREGFK